MMEKRNEYSLVKKRLEGQKDAVTRSNYDTKTQTTETWITILFLGPCIL
jgi:hypothetical protein